MTISSLGYARISLQNPQDWAQVGEEVLGFESSTDEDGSVRLRMDESPFRYLVEKSETEGFVCAGWECPAEKFDEIVNLLDNRNKKKRNFQILYLPHIYYNILHLR